MSMHDAANLTTRPSRQHPLLRAYEKTKKSLMYIVETLLGHLHGAVQDLNPV